MSKKKIIVIPVVIFVIMILLVSIISSWRDVEEHRAFESVDVDICDIYLDDLDLRLILCMYNPNSINAKLDRADITVYGNNRVIAEVDIPYYITIPPYSEIEVDADITLKKLNALLGIVDKIFGEDIELEVEITAYYDSAYGTFTQTIVRYYDI